MGRNSAFVVVPVLLKKSKRAFVNSLWYPHILENIFSI